MSPDKVKLSPESKRTFLEIGLKHATNEHESASKDQKKLLIYSFAKMLCVSGSYLYCYRFIGRIGLRFRSNSVDIMILFKSKFYNSFNPYYVSLTYDSAHKLIKLLLPFYLDVTFHDQNITNSNFKKYLELLMLTKGKIGLDLTNNSRKHFVHKLLKKFTDRIYGLICYMDQFETAERLQFEIFNYLYIYSIEDSGQILRVLKYKAMQLKLCCIGENFTFDDGDLIDLKNETVKDLHLSFERVNYIKIEKLVKQLHKCYSNLKHFHFQADFVPLNEVLVNQVSDHVVSYVKRMNDLKACLENCLVNTNIYFCVPIYINGQHEKSWIKAISDNSEFKHWKIESHEKIEDMFGNAFDEEDLEAIDLDDSSLYFEYCDSLVMKFDDARCKLKMTIKMHTPI